MRARKSAGKLTERKYPRSGFASWAVGGDADVDRDYLGLNAVLRPCKAAVNSVGTTHTLDDSDAAICGNVCSY
jgi:hypothetical protein